MSNRKRVVGRPNKLAKAMATELPSRTDFKKKLFRPNSEQTYEMFDIINKNIFGNNLVRVPIKIRRLRMAYGWCEGRTNPDGEFYTHEIKIAPSHGCLQWFISILSHEMVHHWQWSILSNERAETMPFNRAAIMSHGPSFYQWKKPLNKYGISLKSGY
jgi:hypothetical protein